MSDNRTTELRKALDFMRIWISDDAHLGESEFSYELEKAEGLRKLEAIEQAIAATLGSECGTCHAESDLSEWVCSNCQCWIPLGLTPENIKHASEWRYCPHCGAKVVSE